MVLSKCTSHVMGNDTILLVIFVLHAKISCARSLWFFDTTHWLSAVVLDRTGTPSWRLTAAKPCCRGLSSLDGKVQAEIMDRCNELHASFIQPLNDNVNGPLEKLNTGGYQSTKMPFVFVLGNHSSGKSSFINYVLGRNIQTAGVAPTDDR